MAPKMPMIPLGKKQIGNTEIPDINFFLMGLMHLRPSKYLVSSRQGRDPEERRGYQRECVVVVVVCVVAPGHDRTKAQQQHNITWTSQSRGKWLAECNELFHWEKYTNTNPEERGMSLLLLLLSPVVGFRSHCTDVCTTAWYTTTIWQHVISFSRIKQRNTDLVLQDQRDVREERETSAWQNLPKTSSHFFCSSFFSLPANSVCNSLLG